MIQANVRILYRIKAILADGRTTIWTRRGIPDLCTFDEAKKLERKGTKCKYSNDLQMFGHPDIIKNGISVVRLVAELANQQEIEVYCGMKGICHGK